MSTGGVTIPVHGITIVDGLRVGREGLRLTGGITVFDTGACVRACGGRRRLVLRFHAAGGGVV